MIQYSYRNYKLILPKFARIVLCTYICVRIDISHCGLQIDSVSKLSFRASNKPTKKKKKKKETKRKQTKIENIAILKSSLQKLSTYAM